MSSKVRYILRFDDICPTMNWDVWNNICTILDQAGIKPLLAVIPDNQDPKLMIDPPKPDFWDHVRQWQSQGWSIGLHGYQHRYVTSDSGIVGINNRSEFAGISESAQSDKISKGLSIFRREGVTADAWIAPANSFDSLTLNVLNQLGLHVISDGFTRLPYKDGQGLLWIPHQLWDFMYHHSGVWTIGFHHNAWTSARLLQFQADIRIWRSRIVSFSEIVTEFRERRKTLMDTLHERVFYQKVTSSYSTVRKLASFLCR